MLLLVVWLWGAEVEGAAPWAPWAAACGAGCCQWSKSICVVFVGGDSGGGTGVG